MPAFFGSTLLAALLIVSISSSVGIARAKDNLVDPGKVFLEDAEMPRGFQRLVDGDTWTANPGLITAIRQYYDGAALIQQIIYSASTPEKAQQVGEAFFMTLPDRWDIEFNEILTLGDRALSAYGEDADGVIIHMVAFQRSTLVGIVTWIEKEGADLEADTTALAARMEARARAALPKP
jgi:hypothetical protein